MLGTLLFGLAFGFVLKNSGFLIRALLLTCLLVFSLDLIGSFELKGKIICAIAAFLFSWFIREKALKILTFAFSVFIAAALVFPSERLSPILKTNDGVSGKSGLPPVVHLILDAHIGVEGIPEDIGMGRQFKKDLISFYSENGFRLYGNAYSHYSITLNSVPSLFNFDTAIEVDRSYVNEITTDIEYELLENRYFEKMSALGYRIKIYQSKYLDYCQEKYRIASCYTYPIFSTHFLENLSTSVSSKVWVILTSYLIRSDFFREGKNGYWHFTNFIRQRFGLALPFPWNWDGYKTSPIAASQALEKLKNDIRYSSKGTMFFAHLIAPHSPFVYDSDCRMYKNPVSEWYVGVDTTSNNMQNSISSRAVRYKKYMRQITCFNLQMQSLFDAMRTARIYETATIIIHGDHGSRIRIRRPTLANQNDLTSEDLLDSFSTLFAVKVPGDKVGYDLRVLSLNQIFSPVAEKMFNIEQNIGTKAPYVNLRVRNPDEKKKRPFVRRAYSVSKNQ